MVALHYVKIGQNTVVPGKRAALQASQGDDPDHPTGAIPSRAIPNN